MTPLLDQALHVVYKLRPEQQDIIATLILDELEDDQRWEAAFSRSQDKLSQLANKVRLDIKAGKVRKMDFDEL